MALQQGGERLRALGAQYITGRHTPVCQSIFKDRVLEIIQFLIDFILHIDKHLEAFVVAYGPWVYALLFIIVFVENKRRIGDVPT